MPACAHHRGDGIERRNGAGTRAAHQVGRVARGIGQRQDRSTRAQVFVGFGGNLALQFAACISSSPSADIISLNASAYGMAAAAETMSATPSRSASDAAASARCRSRGNGTPRRRAERARALQCTERPRKTVSDRARTGRRCRYAGSRAANARRMRLHGLHTAASASARANASSS